MSCHSKCFACLVTSMSCRSKCFAKVMVAMSDEEMGQEGEEVSEGGRKSELYSVEEEHGDAAAREEEHAHPTEAPHHQEHQNSFKKVL